MIPHPAPLLPDAACANHPTLPPETWQPATARQPADRLAIRAAIDVCQRCPELEPCAAWAQQHRPPLGIWGAVLWGVG